MAHFNYTARKKDGTQESGAVEAAGRAAALRILAGRGLTVLSLAGARGGSAPAPKPGRALVWATAAALAGFLLLFLFKTLSAGPASGRRARPRAAAEAGGSPRRAPRHSVAGTSARPKGPRAAAPDGAAPAAAARHPGPARPAAEAAAPDGAAATNRPAFASASEEVLHMLASVEPGDEPPPIPNFPGFDDIPKILDRDILVYDSDDPGTLTAKENVAVMKQHLKDYLATGGKPQEFLSVYRDWLSEKAAEYGSARRETLRILKTEGRAAAAKYAEGVNAKFKADGVKGVQIPEKLWNAAAD